MKTPLLKIKQPCLYLLLLITSITSAKEADSIFLEDNSKLNNVENILLKTSVSHATDDLSIGYINPEAFQFLKSESIVYIKLPGFDQESTLQINKIDHNIEGVTTFSGQVEGIEDSTFIISTEKNKVLGSIKFNGFSYNIEPTSADDNRHVINKMDRFKLVQDMNDVLDFETNVESLNDQLKSQVQDFIPLNDSKNDTNKSATNVKVLFLYANDVNGNLLASQVVTEFNNTANRSLVNSANRIESAGNPQLINSDFGSDSKFSIINRMKGRENEFTDIDIRMKSVDADIAVLLIEASNTPLSNTGRVGGVAVLYFENMPFAVVADDYVLGDLTATHEIGHVLGGAHALPLAPNDVDAFAHGHGIEGSNGLWQTIMGGYTTNCQFDWNASATTQPCERIAYFSNPNVSPPAITGGQAIGSKPAQMASVLNNTMPIVANWGSSSQLNYNSPVKGFSYDPIKSGHGIHISQSGSHYFIYFFSYDQNGNPEWFIGDSTFVNNQLSGTLSKVSYNFTTSNTSVTTVGSFSLNYGISQVNSNNNCDGVNRTLQPGVFNWNINGQSGAWCMKPLFNTGAMTNTPSIPHSNSGLWYEPAKSGWGMSLQIHQKPSNSLYQSYAVTYYYDSTGIGRWVAGLSPDSSSTTNLNYSSMDHVYGYPRNSFGTATTQNVGSLFLDLGPNKTADLNVTYPISPGGSWNRNNATISHLTQ